MVYFKNAHPHAQKEAIPRCERIYQDIWWQKGIELQLFQEKNAAQWSIGNGREEIVVERIPFGREQETAKYVPFLKKTTERLKAKQINTKNS
jgi:hypothetical protein